MSVSLNALAFNRPFTTLVKRNLTITNSNAQPIAFKVKTTAPKLYCVRPNLGRIEPGESVDVSVMLQAMQEEPPLSAKCKDRFLIQSTIITKEKEMLALNEIWNSTDGGEETKVHQQKLKVVYLPPEGQTVKEKDKTQVHQSSLIQDDSHQHDTVREHPQTNGHAVDAIYANDPPPRYEEPERQNTPPADFSVARDESHEDPEGGVGIVSVNVHAAPPPSLPPAVVAAAEPQVDEELFAKYQASQAETERLRARLAAVLSTTGATELRWGNRALSDDGSTFAGADAGTYVDEGAMRHAEGVPLQVVVIIALGVFITAYLFF